MRHAPVLLCFLAALLSLGWIRAETETSLPPISGAAVLTDIKVISSDAYGGRFPGSKGGAMTVAWIQGKFQQIGLKPGNTDGTYIQKVPLVGITPDPNAVLTFQRGQETAHLKYKDDFLASTKHVAETVGIKNSDLVFVGYGVVAPEYHWDDYK